jgi:hypothetical protein
VHGIVCPAGQSCGEKQYSPQRHGIVIAGTGGIRGNINDAVSITNAIERIVDSTISTSGYRLTRPPIGVTLRLALSGTQGTCDKNNVPRSRINGFDFDGVTGTLNFFGNCKPPVGTSSAAVSYRYWIDKTSLPDGSTPPCLRDPFYDATQSDFCLGPYACQLSTNICAMP